MEFTEKTCPSCKCIFETKEAINTYINNRNRRCGGDRYRAYYCPICGDYHLTSKHTFGEHKLRKNASKYNRLDKKENDTRLLRLHGLA